MILILSVVQYILYSLQDLSHNDLNEVPPELENSKGVIVLNLSNNK